jgi:glyceraldehyde 3-phosphate dehydrogenase
LLVTFAPKLSTMQNAYTTQLQGWINEEMIANEISFVVNRLSLEKSVEVIMMRKQLVNTTATDIMNRHVEGSKITGIHFKMEDSLVLLKEMLQADLSPARIDLGRLLGEWSSEKEQFSSVKSFISSKLAGCIESDNGRMTPKDVVLYGFGRIGRLMARELIYQAGNGTQLRLRAIVTRGNSEKDIMKRAELLRTDSIHGKFQGTIVEDYENKCLIVNGHRIEMIDAKSPLDVDYTQYGIENALVVDNTGVWRDEDGLGQHLQSKGVDKVLLTAPGKGDIPNVVFGVNHQDLDLSKKIFSAASCTTNAIVPVLKVVNDTFGLEVGHVETIHSYTNDQNLIDNYHKSSRRGRAATLNMVITETGAGSAVAKALPELKGKITGNSIRVPTPDGSLAVLSLTLGTSVTKESLNDALKNASLKGGLVEQIEFSINTELVSSDIIGNVHASIVDGPATIVQPNGTGAIVYVWYDNEYGYTRQVMRLAKYIGDVIRFTYY